MARLVFVAGLLLASLAFAQEPQPETIDYSAFGSAAASVEQLVADPSASDEQLETVRGELAAWRSTFLAAENANETTIARLQAQLEALGPAPEEGSGVVEPLEIAQRRDELNRQLAEAQVPRVNALEAFNRANGLIAEIDAELRDRKTATLLQRAPSPLRPSSLAAAGVAVWEILGSIQTEIGKPLADPEARASLAETAVGHLLVFGLGLLILFRSRKWIDRLSRLALRKRARATVVFILSLGQVFLPVLGAMLMLVSFASTDLAGEKLTLIVGGVIGLLATTFSAIWLAGRVFPQDEHEMAALSVPVDARPHARRVVVALGIVLGLGLILQAVAEFEEVDEAVRAVFLLPYFLALSVVFWSLTRVLGRVGDDAGQDRDAESSAFVIRLVAILVTILRTVAVAGPLLAIAGFVNAADGLMRPTGLSLGLLAVFVAVQVPIRDLYALVTRTPPEDAGHALVPVLINFVLAVLSLPLFALVWGMRRTEIAEVFSRIQEGISFGGTRITPGAILTVILVFAFAILVTRLIQGALKSTVLPRTKLDSGAQNAVAAGVGYIGVAVAALVAINAAGIDLTTLAFVISALSVGIGFGLRNVIENFVAGLILLIERPISEGDWIEVGGNMGIVKQISVRSTVIETFDKQQLIVPNGDFITGTVTNWTRGNQVGRAVVDVGVAYGTDTRKVQEILLAIAKEQAGVMRFPEPGVDFVGFGLDSLDFRIRAVLYDVNTLLAVKTELHHRIAERFKEEGIKIPFAQRDIWLRNPEALAPPRPAPPGSEAGAIREGDNAKQPRREADSVEGAADLDGDQT